MILKIANILFVDFLVVIELITFNNNQNEKYIAKPNIIVGYILCILIK